MKILFITSTRIGDAVLTTSILNWCLKTYPMARFTIACGPLAASLFADIPQLEKIISLPRKKGGGHWFDLWCQTVSTPWDLTIDLRGSLITFLMRSGKRYIWRSQASSSHRVEQMNRLFNVHPSYPPYLWVSEERLQRVQAILPKERNKLLILGPAANWIGKEWPLNNFIHLTERLIREEGLLPGAKVVVLGASHERERLVPFFQAFSQEQCIDLVGQLDLLDLSALMRYGDLFVGNDSGLMHVAAASGLATVGLFGPSNERCYAPYGEKNTFIRTPESYETLKEKWHKGQEEGLMNTLQVEDVYNHIQYAWGNWYLEAKKKS